ncbi:DEAD-box ATP-dependent RNA helicase 57, partial [Tanacetum coccineum]
EKKESNDPEETVLETKTTEAEPAPKHQKKRKRKINISDPVEGFDKHNIHTSGTNIPSPLQDFSELRSRYECQPYILRNLAELKIKEPTPIQMQAIPILLSGRDVFACAPTGSGKTLAFVCPMLMKLKCASKDGVPAVILCPTRELASQTYRECLEALGAIRTGFLGHSLRKSGLGSETTKSKLNTAYPIPLNTAYPVLCPIQRIHPNRLIRLRMTKVIKGEFEKIKDVKVEDVSLTCNTSLEIFNMEVSRLSGMDNDLFTYKVEVANIPWEGREEGGGDRCEVRAYDDDDEDEIAEVFRIDTNIFDYETPICSTFNEFNYLLKNKDVPWVDEKPWTDTGVWTEPKLVKHTCELFNYKTGYSEWPTYSWKEDSYCNGGNLPRTYIIENQLHYQDYEWYEALDDCEFKVEALRNKAIMDGVINDDESCSELKRKWNIYTNYNDAYEINHEDNGNIELCEIHEPPVCNIRKYMMIKYSFNDDEKYVAIKDDELDDLIMTRRDAYQAYQEIFLIMDE